MNIDVLKTIVSVDFVGWYYDPQTHNAYFVNMPNNSYAHSGVFKIDNIWYAFDKEGKRLDNSLIVLPYEGVTPINPKLITTDMISKLGIFTYCGQQGEILDKIIAIRCMNGVVYTNLSGRYDDIPCNNTEEDIVDNKLYNNGIRVTLTDGRKTGTIIQNGIKYKIKADGTIISFTAIENENN